MIKKFIIPALFAVFVALFYIFAGQAGIFAQKIFFPRSTVMLSSPELPEDLPSAPPREDALHAFVHSRYPFNFKDELLVSVGREDGIKEGDAAVFDGGYVGRVEKVFERTALVKTIFSADFQLAVRVGDNATDSLFVGGILPRLTLLADDALVNQGDSVYTAGPGAPYGIFVGSVEEVHPSADQLFREALIIPKLKGENMREMWILPHQSPI